MSKRSEAGEKMEQVLVSRLYLAQLASEIEGLRETLDELDTRTWEDEKWMLLSDADSIKDQLEGIASSLELITNSVRELRHREIQKHFEEFQAIPVHRDSRWIPDQVAGGKKDEVKEPVQAPVEAVSMDWLGRKLDSQGRVIV